MEKAKDDIDSAGRKIKRVMTKIVPHDFEARTFKYVSLTAESVKEFEKQAPGMLDAANQDAQNPQCLNCGKQKNECLGNNGFLSEAIKEHAENLKHLLFVFENKLNEQADQAAPPK